MLFEKRIDSRSVSLLVVSAIVVAFTSAAMDVSMEISDICTDKEIFSTEMVTGITLGFDGKLEIPKRDESRFLGEGSFGVVLRQYLKPHGMVALKVTERTPQNELELKILYNLKKLFEASKEKREGLSTSESQTINAQVSKYPFDQFISCYATETLLYVAQTLLLSKLETSKIRKFLQLKPLETKLSIIRDLVASVDFLHGHDVIHRDIKPQNIVSTNVNVDKLLLIDFGVATLENTKSFAGSLLYAAPEVFLEKGFEQGKPYDAWSLAFSLAEYEFGIDEILSVKTVFMCVVGRYLDPGWTDIMNTRVAALLDASEPKFTKMCGKESFDAYKGLFVGGLNHDPKKRATLKQMVASLDSAIQNCQTFKKNPPKPNA